MDGKLIVSSSPHLSSTVKMCIRDRVYSAKMNIHGVEGEFCNKCSDTFEPLMRQINTISNVRDYENTLDRINYLFENNLCLSLIHI